MSDLSDLFKVERERAALEKERDSLLEIKACLLEALENLENDDGSIPAFAWDMVKTAIAKAKGGAK